MVGSAFVKTGEPLSRRRFFAQCRDLAAAGLVAATLPPRMLAETPSAAAPGPRRPGRSRVVLYQSERVISASRIHNGVLADMLAACLTTATSQLTPAAAWDELLGSAKLIGLKFNRVGADALRTTPPLARALVASLADAGIASSRLVLIETPPDLTDEFGTTPPATGWTTWSADFGKGPDQFAAVVDQVDALVNVPFLKTHNIAGMTAGLKNLSHGLIRHPARYHDHHCSPFIADICGAEPLRTKLRFTVVNALRVVYDGGPEVRESSTWNGGALLVGRDPVAVDTISLEFMNDTRTALLLPPISTAAVEYLGVTAAAGLGNAHRSGIELVRLGDDTR